MAVSPLPNARELASTKLLLFFEALIWHKFYGATGVNAAKAQQEKSGRENSLKHHLIR